MSARQKPALLPNSCLIASPNGTIEAGTGVPLVTHVTILSEGLVNAEYQQCSAGPCNPVAYGFRLDRRNSPGRWQRHRSFCKIQAPPASRRPAGDQEQLARRQCLDPLIRLLLGKGLLLRQ